MKLLATASLALGLAACVVEQGSSVSSLSGSDCAGAPIPDSMIVDDQVFTPAAATPEYMNAHAKETWRLLLMAQGYDDAWISSRITSKDPVEIAQIVAQLPNTPEYELGNAFAIQNTDEGNEPVALILLRTPAPNQVQPARPTIIMTTLACSKKRRGIATWLMRIAFRKAMQEGYTHARWQVRVEDREAVAFYDSLGSYSILGVPGASPFNREVALSNVVAESTR